MSTWVAILTAATIEAFLISFFYGYLISRVDQFGSISSSLISFSVFCGMASVPLIVIIGKIVSISILLHESTLIYNLVDCYYNAAFIEETGKFYLYLLLLHRLKQYRLPIHGIILFSLCGLGFSVVENLHYLIGIGFGTAVHKGSLIEGIMVGGFIRGTPGHILFDAIAGYYFGLAKYKPKHENIYFIKGWIIAIILRGTFNLFPSLADLIVYWTGEESSGILFMLCFYIYVFVLIFITHKVFQEGFKISTREIEYYKLSKGEMQYIHKLRLDRIEDYKRFRNLLPLLFLGVLVFFVVSIVLMILLPDLTTIG